jgi:uncharacterized protein YndB with AHSA1/START domain
MMKTSSFRLTLSLPASPERVYRGWLSSKDHAAFTGGAVAKTANRKGFRHAAWDGYITGRNLELEPYRRIVQSWRTEDFSDDQPDSLLELLFEPTPRGTRLVLMHRNLPPEHAAAFKQGWKEHYFVHMRAFFAARKTQAR